MNGIMTDIPTVSMTDMTIEKIKSPNRNCLSLFVSSEFNFFINFKFPFFASISNFLDHLKLLLQSQDTCTFLNLFAVSLIFNIATKILKTNISTFLSIFFNFHHQYL